MLLLIIYVVISKQFCGRDNSIVYPSVQILHGHKVLGTSLHKVVVVKFSSDSISFLVGVTAPVVNVTNCFAKDTLLFRLLRLQTAISSDYPV